MFDLSDSDELEDDLVVMNSQGLLSKRECLVLLSPITYTDFRHGDKDKQVKKNNAYKHHTTNVRPQTETLLKSKTVSARPKSQVQNVKDCRQKSSHLPISKTLFSPSRVKKKRLECVSSKTEKEAKMGTSQKSLRGKKVVWKESESDSSDLEDPSIILKKLSGDSTIHDDVINETMSEDDLFITVEGGHKAHDVPFPLLSSQRSGIKSGPRHSSPIKKAKKTRNIFDRIRKENARRQSSQIEPPQDSIEISDSDMETDFSQSFIKCTQEQSISNGRKDDKSKRSGFKKPLLSLKTARVPAVKEHVSNSSSDSDLEDPTVHLKKLKKDSSDIFSQNNDQYSSDKDLFSNEDSTELLETQPLPSVVSISSRKPYKLSEYTDTTIEYGKSDDDTQTYSIRKEPDSVPKDVHNQSAIPEITSFVKYEGKKGDHHASSKSNSGEINFLSSKDTIMIEDKERDTQESQSFLTLKETEEISLSSDTSMPVLSPQTSVVVRQDVSSDISLPQLSQYFPDITPPKKEIVDVMESAPVVDKNQIEKSPTICSYSMEADFVAVFDSEDEELFLTQSIIDRSNENGSQEVIVKDEDVSEEEIWLNSICQDSSSSPSTKQKNIRMDEEETQVLTEECTQNVAKLVTNTNEAVQDHANEEEIEQNTLNEAGGSAPGTSATTVRDGDANSEKYTDAVDENYSGEDDSAADSDEDKCYTVRLNIYRPPTPEDFKHILYPEKSTNAKSKGSKPFGANERTKQSSANHHPHDYNGNLSNDNKTCGTAISALSSGKALSTKVIDLIDEKSKDVHVDKNDNYGLSTQVCEKKDTDDMEDVDDDVYLAQTQIDYLVISSDDDESVCGANEVEENPSPASSLIADPNNTEDGTEQNSDFEHDIDLLDVKSSDGEIKSEKSDIVSESGYSSDLYAMATQVDHHEMSEEDKEADSEEENSNSKYYMADTQIDETVSEVDDDGDEKNSEIELQSSKNVGDDDENMNAYLMDTQVDDSDSDENPLQIEEMDPYGIDTQVDPVEDASDQSNSPLCQEDPFDGETLEMDYCQEWPLARDDSGSVQSEKKTKDRDLLPESQEAGSGNDTADSGNASKLISRISEDDDVSENNIVEYMMSTQIDPRSTFIGRESRQDKLAMPTKKSLKVPTVTKGLFDIFSESNSGIGVENKASDISSTSSRKDKPNKSSHTNKNDQPHVKSPKSPGNLFSLFKSDSFSKSIKSDGRDRKAVKESNTVSNEQDKEGRKRVHLDSHVGREFFLPPHPQKKSEAVRKTQIVPPKWISPKNTAVDKSSNSTYAKSQRSAMTYVKPVVRKRKNSNKLVDENISCGIASAKKKFDERLKSGAASTKSSTGKDILLKRADLSDVEMPNTQEIMEQGLPILNMVSPIVKKTVEVPSAKELKKPEHSKSSTITNTIPKISPTSTHYSSLPGATKASSSTSSIQQPQQSSVTNQTTMDQVKEKPSVRKIPSLPKSVYLHNHTVQSSAPSPSPTTATLPSPDKKSDTTITQEKEKSSPRKSPSLPKSIYLSKDFRNNTTTATNNNVPISYPLPITSNISPLISTPLTSLKSPPTPMTHSPSTTLTVSSSTSLPCVSTLSNSKMQIPSSSSSLSITVPGSTTTTTSPGTISSVIRSSEMSLTPSSIPVVTTVPFVAVTAPSKVQMAMKGATSTETTFVVTNSSQIKTSTISTSVVNSSTATSSTILTASTTPKLSGPMIRRPKHQKRGILKSSSDKGIKFKSRKVRFDDSRNMIKFIEKLDSRPSLLHIDSTTKKINKEPFRTPNQFIQTVLKWNTSWIFEQEKAKGQPPPIIEPGVTFSRVKMAYDDIDNYQDITYRLFVLEVWAMLSNEWATYPGFLPAFIKAKPEYLSQGDADMGLLTMEVEGITSDPQTVPMVSDVVELGMQGKLKGSTEETTHPFEQFGFVVEVVKKARLEQNHNSILYRPQIKAKFQQFMKPGAWIFAVKIKFKFKSRVPCDLMRLRKISSLTTALRQFQGLVEFAKIPMCPALLDPEPSNAVFSLDESLVPDSNLLKYLNKEQASAVTQIREAVLRYPNHPRVCLLQGPPGTGKSFAVMVLVHQILLNTRFEARIFLAAPSNAAVDEIATRIIDLSEKKCKPNKSPAISIVRLGNIDSVSKTIKPYHITSLTDYLLSQDQQKRVSKTLQDEMKSVDAKISSLTAELNSTHISEAQKVSKSRELNRLRTHDKKKLEQEMKPPYEVRRKAKYSVINNCHVVCGTLSSFGSGEMMPLLRFKNANQERREPFTCLIIDEATQAVELDCLIPLQHQVNKLVLVGDQEQLPATVLSEEARNCRYDLSLFQRLYDKFESCKDDFPNPVMMLKQQYRMHPEILKLPNSYFYKSLLSTAPSCIKSRVSNLNPYLVFDIMDGVESAGSSGSKSNKNEAKCVALLCQAVVDLMSKKNNVTQRQNKVGVICPYTDQKKAIQDSLRQLGLYNILVNTVDSFQGQEKDVIILSCVRAQSHHQSASVGFVDDSKRMNVALTRAKLALYIVGHRKTLSISDLWKLLYNDAEQRGLLTHVPTAERFGEIASRKVPLSVPHQRRR